MKSFKIVLIVFVCSLLCLNIQAQGLKAFKLPNGLSVFIWEDENVAEVVGMLAVNVGAKDDPEDLTGTAHYLEHLMFKGTEKIGTMDWEKEKPIYEQIIAKYDERAKITDPVQREAISNEINRLTIEAAKYNIPNEVPNLIQNIAGENVNAATNFDYTIYYNSFPPGEIYKWLELYSERLINPVYRNFQTELETVYEEYNRGQDEQGSQESEFILKNLFPGHPYSRQVIGLPDHLKNPQLSKLIEFQKAWYVPENMALILMGNIKANEAAPLIREKFGRLENKPVPAKKEYPLAPLKGRKEVSAKLSNYPQVMLSFPGITADSEDEIALDICTSILSNSSRTGLIDKLVIDGDMLSGSAYTFSLKERGVIVVSAVPYYDTSQRRFESLKSTEKNLLKEIKKLQDGKFENWLVQSIKGDLIRQYDMTMESHYVQPSINTRVMAIADAFLHGKDMGDLLNYKEKVANITTEEIKAIAKKYFGPDYLVLNMNEGKPKKGESLEKPGYEPVVPVRDAESDYAKAFKLLPAKYSNGAFGNMNEVEIRPINDLSKLFYTKNPENEVFTLTLKFGIGTEKMPKLELATPLMNNAGIMAQMKAQEVKQEFSNLGTTCRYSVDDSYLYVTLSGFETNLEAACNLMTRQILLPELDEKQMNSLQANYFQGRKLEKTMNESLSDALRQYLMYKDKSEYLDRLNLEDITNLTVSELTGEFQRATDYEAEIHYVGTLPLDEVYDILSKNLPLKEGEKASTSPEVKERVAYTENTIFFLPNSDAKQSTIYFYIQGDEHPKEKDIYADAFNRYFGAGFFTDLVSQEIREYRSLAYSSYGYYASPRIEYKESHFFGYLGTQADKTLTAIDVFMNLLEDMPQYPSKIENIKSFLKGSALVEKPNFRNASQTYESWKRRGYSQSPAETYMSDIDNMTFEDIVKFFEENIKGRPIAIAIVGDPKKIDEKALSKYGKVTKLSISRLFSSDK